MKFFAIRHGQTKLNVQGLLNGSIPDELTEKGMQQARDAVAMLPQSITHIYSSPLHRAKQTAEIINSKLQLPLTFHSELQEVHFGSIEGTPFLKEYQERHANLDFDWRPTGENIHDVKTRIIAFLKQLQQSAGDGEALLVVHGGIIRVLTNLETGELMGDIANAEIFTFDLDKILANQSSV